MKKYNVFILLLSFSAILLSCQNELEDKGGQPINVKLLFTGGKSNFTQATTRSTMIGWKNNDVVHLILDNGEKASAIYSETEGFSLALYGYPNNLGTLTCRHFENGQTSDHVYYSFTGLSAEYVLNNVSYSYNSGSMMVQGTLSPNCSRLRFKGQSGQSVTVSGFSHLASYDFAYDDIKKTTSKLSLSIGSNGYTDYIYGYPNESNTISIEYNGTTSTKTLSSSILPVGSSGYIDLSEIEHNSDPILHMEGVNIDDFTENGSLDKGEYSLTASLDQIHFESESSSSTVSITSNDSWTVSCSDSWFSVDKTSGNSNSTIKISAIQNTSTSERQGYIQIKGQNSGKIVSVKIVQSGASYNLEATPTTVTLGSVQSSQSITVTSNDSWSLTKSDSWITLSRTSGSNNGTFTITATANTGAQRTAKVTIQGSNSKKSVTISVTQAKSSDIGREDYPDDGQLDQRSTNIERNDFSGDNNLD